MVKLKLVRVAAATAASAGLIAGFSGIAAAHQYGGNYNNHNQGSNKTITLTTVSSVNNVGVNNYNPQDAESGAALVLTTGNSNHGNNNGGNYNGNNNDGNRGNNNRHSNNGSSNSGSALTGDVSNEATFKVDGTVTNNSNGMPSDSSNSSNSSSNHGNNLTVTKTTVQNTNTVQVNNTVDQYASSGDATVKTDGGNNSGDATTGAASNTSTVGVTLDVSN